VAIQSIYEHPREGREQERRYLSEKSDDAEQEDRVRETIHQPAGRDARDPRTDQRYGLTAEEEPVIAVL
jgi:hypothetical protein